MAFIPDLSRRNLVPERMDDPNLPASDHALALRGLRRINRFSGTVDQLARVVLGIIKTQRTKNLAGKKWTILDIGCANGENLIALQRKLSKEIDIQAIGWDISPYAVEQATLHCRENRLDPTQVRFEVVDILGGKQGTPSGEQVRDDAHRAEPVADIVMNSLFLHHFEVPDILRILKKSVALSRVAVIADDLERTRVGWLLAKIGCHVLSRSPVVHFDGPQSVRAAFTAEEMRQLAEEAGLKSISIVRHWPARYSLIWQRNGSSQEFRTVDPLS